MNNLGEKIKTLRERKGYSQTEFSEILGVSRQSISKWENNETTPDAFNLKSIANTFKISLDQLLEVKPNKELFEPKPIHKLLSTTSMIIFIGMALIVCTIITLGILSISNGLSINTGNSIINVITPRFTTYISIFVILLAFVLLTVPLVMMILYRRGLNKVGVPLDSLLIIVIVLTITNPLLGLIHIISLLMLYNEKRIFNTI